MSRFIPQEIEDLTRKLLTYADLTVPVDTKRLVESFDDLFLDVRPGETFTDKNENGYKIHLNSELSELEQKQELAVELGHIFLGHVRDYPVLYRRGANDIELPAYDFAASLLLPKDEFVRKVYDFKDGDDTVSLEKLAKYFGVSYRWVRGRGLRLGLFL